MPPRMLRSDEPRNVAMNPNRPAIWKRMKRSRLSYTARPSPTAFTIVPKLSSVRIMTAACLRDLRAGDAHGDADVGLLERRRVVHAVAGHGHDVALLAQDVHEVDLVLGRDAGEDADAVDLAHRLLVAQGAEVGAGHGAALDAQLAGDRLGGDGVVAGDHADLDAGRMGGRDGVLRGRPRRIDDAHDGEERQAVEQRQQVGVRVERGRVEVLLAGRHDPQAHACRGARSRRGTLSRSCATGTLRAVGAVRAHGAGQELVRGALDVAADDVLARVVRHGGGTWPSSCRPRRRAGSPRAGTARG